MKNRASIAEGRHNDALTVMVTAISHDMRTQKKELILSALYFLSNIGVYFLALGLNTSNSETLKVINLSQFPPSNKTAAFPSVTL